MAADKKGKPLLECTEIPLSEHLDGPDKYSPLNGVDLVRNKVKETAYDGVLLGIA